MFTGIVQTVAVLLRKEKRTGMNNLVLEPLNKKFLEGVEKGDSILVNGICLTVINVTKRNFAVEYMPETEQKTTIRKWMPSKKLNLEKSLRPGKGFDGHIVQGHVDSVGTVSEFLIKGNDRRLKIKAEASVTRYLVPKGSIALDGISLTVIDVGSESFTVGIIKHTFENTALKFLKKSDPINIETDIIGKYVEKLLQKGEK